MPCWGTNHLIISPLLKFLPRYHFDLKFRLLHRGHLNHDPIFVSRVIGVREGELIEEDIPNQEMTSLFQLFQ